MQRLGIYISKKNFLYRIKVLRLHSSPGVVGWVLDAEFNFDSSTNPSVNFVRAAG